MSSQIIVERRRPGAALLWLASPAMGRVAELVLLLGASKLALWTRFESPAEFSPYGWYAIIAGLLLAANLFQLLGLYRPAQLFAARTVARLVVAWATVMLVLIAIGYATATADEVSRLWAGLWFAYGASALVLWRAFGCWLNDWSEAAPGLWRSLAVVGTPAATSEFLRRFGSQPQRHSQLVGVYHDHPATIRPGAAPGGSLDELVAACRAGRVDEIVVATDGAEPGWLRDAIGRFRQLPVDIAIHPTLGGTALPLRAIRDVGNVQVISVAERPLAGAKGVVKRLEDIGLASLVLLLTLPLMVVVAIAIKLDSRGPVFFRQQRYGFNNDLIEVLKFRTMRADGPTDDAAELRQATREDARVTRVGRWLRRTSIDELPQFFQVLGGQMSVVGPRPHAIAHNQKYAQLIDAYQARHRVRPGITGWAQVNGWRGETDTLAKMEKRIEFDLYYIENWSIWFDLQIVVLTVFRGMVHANAY